MRNIQKSQNKSSAYSSWMANYKEQADIVVNDIPSNAPYNLDMTQYQKSDDSNSTSNNSSSSDTSSSDSSEPATTETTKSSSE